MTKLYFLFLKILRLKLPEEFVWVLSNTIVLSTRKTVTPSMGALGLSLDILPFSVFCFFELLLNSNISSLLFLFDEK